MKKVAVVTDDGKIISAHFGRAPHYAVLTIADGQIIARELRDKAGHRDFQQDSEHDHAHHAHGHGHGHGRHAGEKHKLMFAAIPDCHIVLARGMGQGAYDGLQQRDIRPILTDMLDIDTAVTAVIDGSIVDLPERLH